MDKPFRARLLAKRWGKAARERALKALPPGTSPTDPLTASALSVSPWDHERLAKIRFKILKEHLDAVTSCHFCFDDTKIISSSFDGTVKLWDIANSISICTFKDEYTGPISECCLSPNNKRNKCYCAIMDSVKLPDKGSLAIGSLAILGMITASYDKSLKAWDVETGKVLWTLEQDGLVTSCDFSQDGKYVVSGSDIENALFICNAEDAKQVSYVRDHHKSTVRRCRFDPQNQRVATVSSDMCVKFWDIVAQSTTVTIERAHDNAISDCCFTMDGHYLCTAGWDEVLKLWDIRTGEFRSHGPIILDQGHIGIVGCCDVSKDVSLVVSGGYDKIISVWDLQEAYKKIKLKGHEGWVTDVEVSKDKNWLVSSSQDCTVRVWDIANANDVPVVIEAIKRRGSKIAKCEKCGKSFLIFQNDEEKVETNCVFCRLASREKSILPEPPPLSPDL